MQESYIVRIFRRNSHEPSQAIGTVEHVETAEQIAFQNPGDLVEFLRLSRRQCGASDTNK
jgi:hypothetical protein